jgi:hypothetical protein
VAIVSVNESVKARAAAWTFNKGFKSAYTRSYIVVADETVEDLNDILQLSGAGEPGPAVLPEMGDAYPTDGGCSVSGFNVQPQGDERLVFLVIVEYTNPPPSGHGYKPSELDWEFSTESQQLDRIAEVDYGVDTAGNTGGNDGLGEMTNSALEWFDPPVMESETVLVINLSKYFDTWKLQDQIDREGYINDAEVKVLGKKFEKHSLMCTRWTTPGKQVVDGGTYFRLEAQFIYREPRLVLSDNETKEVAGWNRAVLDLGFRHRPGGLDPLSPLVPIPDGAGGAPTTVPRKLNGLGQAQPDQTSYPGVYLFFRTKKEADMSAWGLPLTLGDLEDSD